MIGVLLVSRDESVLKQLRTFAAEDDELQIIAEASGGDETLEKVENTSPDVLILHLGGPDTDSINIAERIIRLKPRTFVMIVTEERTVEVLEAANAVGCHNIMSFPNGSKELTDAIHRIYNVESSRIAALGNNERVVWASNVITVFGAKGGLGKTTISTNLAVCLAGRNKKVVLLDLDLQFGNVDVFMDADPQATISDLMDDIEGLTIDSLSTYMTIHPSGVHLICAPRSPEYADAVSGEKVQRLIAMLRSYYDYVIIDTGTNFYDATLSAFESSTLILFLTGLDISILKNSKTAMNILESLGQKKKVRTIINRAVETKSITAADVQQIVDAPILCQIPSDYFVAVAAINRGQPFVQSAPKSKLSLAMYDITEKILDGFDTFDIQQLSPRARRALMKKYRTHKRASR